MACKSISLPALTTCPGNTVRDKATVCASCYAMLNNYVSSRVRESQAKRYKWIKTLIGAPNFLHFFKALFKQGIGRSKYFRGHDSGDFFSVEYIELWVDVCRAFPDVKFFFPTRSHENIDPSFARVLSYLDSLQNVRVRPSQSTINRRPEIDSWFSPGCAVTTDRSRANCKKTLLGGSCETHGCRDCWERYHEIIYYVHGRGVGGRKGIGNRSFVPETEIERRLGGC
jgi:hypothetical protein